MAFTNVWDVTQPPDTQPANQLGLDLRNLKTDTMQRMSAISGLLVNRPTPETVNADWTGLLYFATDTRQIFQWSNALAAWADVTISFTAGSIIARDFGAHAHTGDVAEDTIYTLALIAGFLGTTGALRIRVALQSGVTSGGFTIRVRLGGVVVFTTSTAIANQTHILDVTLANRGNPAVQVTSGTLFIGLSGAQSATFTTAINTAIAQNLTVSVQSNANGDVQTFNQFTVEAI